MANKQYPFPLKYQRKLLKLLILNGSQLIANQIIKPEYLEDQVDAIIASAALDLYNEYGTQLTFNAVEQRLRNQVKDPDSLKEIKQRLKKLAETKLEEVEEKLITEQVVRFARHQAFKQALAGSIDLLENDKLEDLENQWQQAFQVGQNIADRGIYYFDNFPDRQRERLKKPEVLPTLIDELDGILSDGGFGRKELNAFLGKPGVGKSFALFHMAKVSVVQKRKTVIYSLEMSARKIADRLDASFAGIEIRELRQKGEVLARKLNQVSKRFGNNLVIKEFPAGTASPSTLRMHINSLRMNGFDPEVVIVDYLNLLKPNTDDYSNSYEGVGSIYIQLRALSQEYNLWMITASQANRNAGKESPVIDIDDISDTYQGSMHSDVLISMNQTKEEADRDALRLYIAKNRGEASKKTITIYTNYAKGSLVSKK